MKRLLTLLLLVMTSMGLFAQINVTVGTGTVQNTSTSYPAPYGNFYWGARHQFIIPASELTAAGGFSGNITALAFDVATISGTPLVGFEVRIGTTTATALGTWQAGPFTQLYYNALYTETAGWNTHTFSTPFNWDGVSNLIVETCFNNGSYITNAVVNQTSTTYISSMWINQDNTGTCVLPGSSTALQRPNIRFTFAPSLALDAGVQTINSPVPPAAPGTHSVTATLRNYGTNTLTSATVNWSVNGVLQTPYAWTGSLTTAGSTAPLALGSFNFPIGPSTIKAWSSAPNSGVDSFPSNDTATAVINFITALNGTYTIGGTGANYQTIASALSDMVSAGISGPVVFNISPGTYNEQITFPEILGASATNTITFKSSTNNPNDVIWQFTGTSAANFTFKLNGGDYYSFKYLTIKNNDINYGRVIDLTAGATRNLFEGNRIISAGASSSTTGCIYDGATLNHYNTYLNNYMSGGYYTMYIYGVSTASWQKGTVIKGNEIVGSYYYPIYLYYCDSIEVIGNKVHSGVSPYSYGINVYYVNNYYRIVGNTVNIVATSSTACYGMRDAYGNYAAYNANPTGYGLVANNMISIQGGTGTHYGLYSYYCNGTETAFNTILITGGSTTSRALHQASTSTNTLGQSYRNNIMINTGGGYAAYYTTVAQVSTCDYNNYYTSGVNLAYWAAARANLAALQTASSKDINAISTNITFTSLTDLHTNALATYQTGTPIALVTEDIDGQLRHPSTPCMGADEYILYNNDATITMMTVPTAPCPGTSDVKVKVKNVGLQSFTGVTVNWSINNVAQTPYIYTGTLASNADAEVTLGSYNFLAGVTYNLVFNSLNPGSVSDQNPANDTLTILGLQTAMSGTYTVGPAPTDNFSTLNGALNALKTRGVCGPVIVNIAPGTYNENLLVTAIPGASATNTITFKSANNNNTSVLVQFASGSADNFVVRMNGAQWFRFQHITFQATGVSYGWVFEYMSGASNNEVTNCKLLTSLSTSSNFAGIYSTSSAPSNYNTFSDNVISGGYYGIYWYGASTAPRKTGLTLSNNIIENWYYYGAYIYYTDSVYITGNTVKNQPASGVCYGIYLAYNNGDALMDKNKIFLNGTSTQYGLTSYYKGTTPNDYLMISNNAVNINAAAAATVYAMYIYYPNYVKVYHNTVNVTGGSPTAAYACYQVGGTNQEFQNNIFSNTGGGRAYYVGTSSAVLQSNYNNYFTTATPLAYWGANVNDLMALQLASSKDGNSVSTNPVYASTVLNNLTPLSVNIDNMGTPLGILTDVTGATRSLTTPDIGAYEFTGINSDIALISGKLTNGQCLGINDSVYVTIGNVIGSTLNFATNPLTIHWSVTGPANSTGSYILNSGTLASSTNMTVGITGVTLSQPGDYSLGLYLSANAFNLFGGNDTLSLANTLKIYNPFEVTPGNVVVTNNMSTVAISAKSTFFPGGAFYFSELCNYKYSVGAPTAGWPTWLMADDYIEITGVPNSDLGGYTFEAWNTTALINSHTFPAGTLLGPNGTAIIAIGQPGSSVPSPVNFYYHGNVSYTHGSSDVTGRLLKDPNGNVVDAAGYSNFTFPAASGVTATEWSSPNPASAGTTSGMRLIGPDNNTGSNWVVSSATYPQDPNTVNPGTTVPSPQSLTGFTWSYNGVVFATNVIDTIVGPWTTNGTYKYVASYITPCGTLTDTVTVTVAMVTISGDTTICQGDSAMISVDLPGIGPWTIVGNDGTGLDTFVVTTTPWISYVSPSTTATYTLVAFADSNNVFTTVNLPVVITVIPGPTVSMAPLSSMCASAASFTLTGGLPSGGVYGGPGVAAGVFDPWTAGPGTHQITYTYTDPTTGCSSTAAEPIVLGAGPTIAVTPDHDICPGESTLLEVNLAGSVTSLIFSEYIEGSSFNKAIELFNATPDTLDLANYRIAQSVNGGGWAYWHAFPSGAKLAPHATWVMVHAQVSSTYYDTTLANQVIPGSSVVNHNGDDARAIEVTTDGGVTWTIIDIIGDPNNDPGTGWPVAGVANATADKTLIRKPHITHGNTDWLLVAGIDTASSEYIVNPVNSFTNLGSHTYNAPTPPNVTYSWSTSATTPSITVSPTVTTTYTVTVTDVTTSCATIQNIVVTVNPAATVNLGPDFNVCADGTATIDAGAGFASYAWSTGATTQTILVDGAIIGLGNTVAYTVTVTNSFGCEGTDVVSVTAIDCSGINDPNSSNAMTFWPNPSDGNFFVKIKGISGDATLRITNATGQTISNELLTLNGELVKEFNLGNLAPGIYFVRLYTNSDVITQQIIIR